MDRIDVKRVQIRTAIDEVGSQRTAQLLVRQVMTPAPNCVSGSVSALEVVRMFHAKEFRHVLVTDQQGRLSGVISDRDVIRCFGLDRSQLKEQLSNVTAAELMSTDLVTISPSRPVTEAVRLMVGEGISCLPVLAEGVLVGILTNTDLHVLLEMLLQPSQSLAADESAQAAWVRS